MNWIEVAGGRKFLLAGVATVLVPVLAKFTAPGEAYIALAGIVASYSAGNAVVTKASFRAGVPPEGGA